MRIAPKMNLGEIGAIYTYTKLPKLYTCKAEKQQLQINEDMEILHHTGESIVVRHENGKAPNKLSVRWHGPYRIIEITKRPQGTVYTCYSPKEGKIADYHASIVQAHPCELDMDAVKSAVLDDDRNFIIEKNS